MDLVQAAIYHDDFVTLVGECNDATLFTDKYPPSRFGLTEDQGLEYLESILSCLVKSQVILEAEIC